MQKLLEQLNKLAQKTNEDWVAGLEERKLDELKFHDKSRDKTVRDNLPKDTYEQLHGNKKFYKTVQKSADYVDGWIEANAPGKIFLDYACGAGGNAIKAAQAGAALSVGLDISRTSVENASQSAQNLGLKNTFFVQGDCENTQLPANSIDVVVCSGMLHHLDLSYTFYELRRILKPGGVILGGEALDYNPVIKWYRNRTPQMRTAWEKNHILSYKDLEFASRFFTVKNVLHWHLFSIAGAYVPSMLPLFNALDAVAMKIPGLKKMSWIFTFELHKPQ